MWLLRWLPNFVWHFVFVILGRLPCRGASFDSSFRFAIRSRRPTRRSTLFVPIWELSCPMPRTKCRVCLLCHFCLSMDASFSWNSFIFYYTVTMQAQEEAPADMQCKDKFLLQSVVTSFGVTTKDITPDMVRC